MFCSLDQHAFVQGQLILAPLDYTISSLTPGVLCWPCPLHYTNKQTKKQPNKQIKQAHNKLQFVQAAITL